MTLGIYAHALPSMQQEAADEAGGAAPRLNVRAHGRCESQRAGLVAEYPPFIGT